MFGGPIAVTFSDMRLTTALAALALVALGLTGCGSNQYESMTCDQLTTETLKMTGVDATESYDLDKVRAINHERDAKGCWA